MFCFVFFFSKKLVFQKVILSRKVRMVRIKMKLLFLSKINKLQLNNYVLNYCPKFIPSSTFHFSLNIFELFNLREIYFSVDYLFIEILLKWLAKTWFYFFVTACSQVRFS